MNYFFSNTANQRTYSIELRERNYPTFEGKYNAYVNVFGQLSGDYLGTIEAPIAMDITPDNVPDILNNTNLMEFTRHAHYSIW